jgi:hypothetical protein
MSEPLETRWDGSMLSVADSPASLFLLPRAGDDRAAEMTVISGLQCYASSTDYGPLGLLLRMLLTSTTLRSRMWFLTWKRTTTKSRRRWKFRLVPSDLITGGRASGFSATPTETANQGCPSMQKWPGCRGIEMTPEAWERRMGYPEGWTHVAWEPSATPSSRRSRSGSRSASKTRKLSDEATDSARLAGPERP